MHCLLPTLLESKPVCKLVKKAAKEIFDTPLPEKFRNGWWCYFSGIFAILIAERYKATNHETAIEQAEIIVDIEPETAQQQEPLFEIIESDEVIKEPSLEDDSPALIPESETTQVIVQAKDQQTVTTSVVSNPFADLFALWSMEVEPLYSEEEVFALAAMNELGAEKLTNAKLMDKSFGQARNCWVEEETGASYLLTALHEGEVH